MTDNQVVLLIQIVVALAVLALFPPGRKLLSWALSQAWTAISWVGATATNAIQAAFVHTFRAHGVIIGNLRPRGAVLPTVAKKTVRRE